MWYEKTILEVFRLDPVDPDQRIGVEIELEGHGLREFDPRRGWVHHEDSSLRGDSAEMVLSPPARLSEYENKIRELYSDMENRHIILRDSMRAGVHIHLNCQHKTLREMVSLCTVAWLTEPAMVGLFAGNERSGNAFCLKLTNAPASLNYFGQMLSHAQVDPTSARGFLRESVDQIKYSATNWATLCKYGTLEFRSLRSPVTPEPVIQWIRLILALESYASRFTDPSQILMDFSGMSPIEFLMEIFRPVKELSFNQLEPYQKETVRAMRILQPLVVSLSRANNWS